MPVAGPPVAAPSTYEWVLVSQTYTLPQRVSGISDPAPVGAVRNDGRSDLIARACFLAAASLETRARRLGVIAPSTVVVRAEMLDEVRVAKLWNTEPASGVLSDATSLLSPTGSAIAAGWGLTGSPLQPASAVAQTATASAMTRLAFRVIWAPPGW